ncbi:hypothetical protein ACPV6D_10625, partial [Corynebacterium propinquum]|uniref:hypothetical protein n=1 Tax=Corynebacterium propinquum TaxID=43769 RepID=UPI003CC0F37E
LRVQKVAGLQVQKPHGHNRFSDTQSRLTLVKPMLCGIEIASLRKLAIFDSIKTGIYERPQAAESSSLNQNRRQRELLLADQYRNHY